MIKAGSILKCKKTFQDKIIGGQNYVCWGTNDILIGITIITDNIYDDSDGTGGSSNTPDSSLDIAFYKNKQSSSSELYIFDYFETKIERAKRICKEKI